MHKSLLLAFALALSAAAAGADLAVWPVDPLEKVFRDAVPPGVPTTQASQPARAEPRAEVARGEHATLQVVVWSSTNVPDLCAEVPAFELAAPGAAPARLPAPNVRVVGYVPVDRPIHKPPADQLRRPPADFPDPLLPTTHFDLPAQAAQPIWITVPIPLDAAPGLYRSTVRIRSATPAPSVPPAAALAELALAIRVYPVQVARTRLWFTNWFNMGARHAPAAADPNAPAFHDLLRKYAKNMAAHRQNVALISPLNLCDFGVAPPGDLTFDFARFDRWVHIFTDAGVIGRIEGGHLGGRAGPWESPFLAKIRRVDAGTVVAESVPPDSDAADAFYRAFLPALVRHLRERGWLADYVQHLADEPIPQNLDSYRALSAVVRRHAPELRLIEATHARDLTGALDIWVPQINYLKRDFEHYRARQQAGDEVWFYTCIYPQGEYANRFIELPLLKVRGLHWINFRYGVTGFLHWGYNFWGADSPFTHTTRAHTGGDYLPAGDAWVVYPGVDGPIDSLRWEAQRDGVVDHELLSRLAERDAPAARRLAEAFVLDFDRYDLDVPRFRAARRTLLEALSRDAD